MNNEELVKTQEIKSEEPSETKTFNGKTEILYFWSPTCWPCKLQSPIVDELSDTYTVLKFDTNTDEGLQAADDNQIFSTPTILVKHTFDGGDGEGVIEKRFIGLVHRDNIISYLEDNK